MATASASDTFFNIPLATYAATGSASSAPIDLNSLLIGNSTAGTWTLTVTDHAAGDTGGLAEWSHDIGLETGTELLSMTQSGVLQDIDSSEDWPVTIAAERYVVFATVSELLSGPTPSSQDLVMKDRQTGALKLISVDSRGIPANGNCAAAAISGDDRFVVFLSNATNPAPDSLVIDHVDSMRIARMTSDRREVGFTDGPDSINRNIQLIGIQHAEGAPNEHSAAI